MFKTTKEMAVVVGKVDEALAVLEATCIDARAKPQPVAEAAISILLSRAHSANREIEVSRGEATVKFKPNGMISLNDRDWWNNPLFDHRRMIQEDPTTTSQILTVLKEHTDIAIQ